MSKVDESSDSSSMIYYMPHHDVLKESSLTHKLPSGNAEFEIFLKIDLFKKVSL